MKTLRGLALALGLVLALVGLAAPGVAIAQYYYEDGVEVPELEPVSGPGLVNGCCSSCLGGGTCFLVFGALGTIFYLSQRRNLITNPSSIPERLILGGSGPGEVQGVDVNRKGAAEVFRSDLSTQKVGVGMGWDEGTLHRAGKNDPQFSVPAIIDFILVLHRQATAVTDEGFDRLAPYLTPPVQQALAQSAGQVTSLDMLTVGDIAAEHVEVQQHWTFFRVKIASIRHITYKAEREAIYMSERWEFRRSAQAVSSTPEEMLAFGCPSCGAVVNIDPHGSCVECGANLKFAQHHWQVSDVSIYPPQKVPEPEFDRSWTGPSEPMVRGGGEPLVDYEERNPDFDLSAFLRWVKVLYAKLRSAWSDAEWTRLRPHVTDYALNRIMYESERFATYGAWARWRDALIDDIDIAKIEHDSFYESVTVWISGTRKEWVEDQAGNVVGGSQDTPVPFSETWTFRRRKGDSQHMPLSTCPVCQANLSEVDGTGVCGGCNSWLTLGGHSWVVHDFDLGEPEL